MMEFLGVTDAGARAARISMIAMNLSILLMMGSMGQAMWTMQRFIALKEVDTAVTLGDAAANETLAVANTKVASTGYAAAGGMKAFIRSTIIGFVAMVALSVFLERLGNALGIWSDDIEDFNDTFSDTAYDFSQTEWVMPDIDLSAIDGIGGASAQLEEFANRREELFFGFKADQVTGDLVKQVQQGGVENFIAHTEIIMRNEFNGMTTDEAAQEIITQIENHGVLSGWTKE